MPAKDRPFTAFVAAIAFGASSVVTLADDARW